MIFLVREEEKRKNKEREEKRKQKGEEAFFFRRGKTLFLVPPRSRPDSLFQLFSSFCLTKTPLPSPGMQAADARSECTFIAARMQTGPCAKLQDATMVRVGGDRAG